MARFVAAAIVTVAALLFVLVPAIDERIILFAFFLGIMIVLANMEAMIKRAWVNKPQRVLEYKVAAIGLGNMGDLHQFERWLETLNNERWELVTIMTGTELDVSGMHYAIFARPKMFLDPK